MLQGAPLEKLLILFWQKFRESHIWTTEITNRLIWRFFSSLSVNLQNFHSVEITEFQFLESLTEIALNQILFSNPKCNKLISI